MEIMQIERFEIAQFGPRLGTRMEGEQAREREDALERNVISTNGGDGIRLAYSLARKSFIDGGINRVILATDGDFNVGTTSRSDLTDLIEKERESGVFLSVLGVGTGNLKDASMEQIADTYGVDRRTITRRWTFAKTWFT